MKAHERETWQQLNVGPRLLSDIAVMMPETAAAAPDILDMLLEDTGRVADLAVSGRGDFDVAARSRQTFLVDLGGRTRPIAAATYSDI